VRESRPRGSVRGALGNGRPYRDKCATIRMTIGNRNVAMIVVARQGCKFFLCSL
jgi:hypothetical protein